MNTGGNVVLKGYRLWLTNLIFLPFLALIVVDGLPSGYPGSSRIDARVINPIAQTLWIDQGSWLLFAPTPRSINVFLEAKLQYSDGHEERWESPLYAESSGLLSVTFARHAKALDALRTDANMRTWEGSARWIARQMPERPGATKQKIRLIRHWWDIPRARKLAEEKKRYSSYPPTRAEFPGSAQYFEFDLVAGKRILARPQRATPSRGSPIQRGPSGPRRAPASSAPAPAAATSSTKQENAE